MLRSLLPLILFVATVAFLAMGLQRDPRLVPSPLIGKPAPEFSLSALKSPERQMSLDDLKGQVVLLNVWATWCPACHVEHPFLVELARNAGVLIYGLNYKDDRDAAIRWLGESGDPYVASIFDPKGLLALDLGVYGAPETFFIDANGIIAYKHIGPITPQIWAEQLLPVLTALRRRG